VYSTRLYCAMLASCLLTAAGLLSPPLRPFFGSPGSSLSPTDSDSDDAIRSIDRYVALVWRSFGADARLVPTSVAVSGVLPPMDLISVLLDDLLRETEGFTL
jgi:hypothetical protein